MTSSGILVLKDTCNRFQYFSVALDESKILKNTAQLAVLVRGVVPSLDIVKKCVLAIPMKVTTTGEVIFIALQTVMADVKLKFSKHTGVTIDGAPAKVGQKKSIVSLPERPMEDLGISCQIKKIHYLIH